MSWIYQLSTILILLCSFFLKTSTEAPLFYIGLGTYIVGVLLFALSVISFAKPNENGINLSGLYRFSRNPMYVAYFIYFLGCVFLTKSPILFFLLCVFQVSAHWIILSEERWCKDNLGDEYTKYAKRVRRYI